MFNKTKIVNFFKQYFLFIILICAFLLRTYKGPELFFWNVDEDIVGLTVRRIFFDHKPQLIGFPVPGGIYLGPLYYYLVSIPYLMSAFDPLKFYIFSALLGTVTTFLIYKVGLVLFEKKFIAIVASFIFATSYLANVNSRFLNGLSIAPILALLTYFFLAKIIKQKVAKKILLFSIVLLIAVQNEGSSFSLVALTIVVFLIYKIRVPVLKFVQVCILFVVFHIPLFIFDLRHNFYTSKSLASFFTKGTHLNPSSFSLSSFLDVFEIFPATVSKLLYPSGTLQTSAQILPCPDLIVNKTASLSPLAFLSAAIILGIYFFVLFFKKRTIGENIIAIHFLVIVLGVLAFNLLFGGYLFEWILVIFLPGFCLICAYVLNLIYEKYRFLTPVFLLVFLLFTYTNIKSIFTSSDDFGLLKKTQVVKYAISQVENSDFHLESLGSCYQTGYLYLFWQLGHFPTTSFADDMFSGTFYARNYSKPEKTIVIASPSKNESKDYYVLYDKYKNLATTSQKFGGVEVLVIDER